MNFYCANIYCVNFYCANLYCVNFYCANFYCVNFYCANFYCANLYCANLYCVNLYCANLYCVNLYCANGYCSISILPFHRNYFYFVTLPDRLLRAWLCNTLVLLEGAGLRTRVSNNHPLPKYTCPISGDSVVLCNASGDGPLKNFITKV